jgi:hypothetical protein
MGNSKFGVLKGYFALAFAVSLLFLLPAALWKSCRDIKGLENNGKQIPAIIIEYRGANLLYEYDYKERKYRQKFRIGSNQDYRNGETIQIICDTLRPENSTLLRYMQKK